MDSTRPYVVIPAGGPGTRLWPISRVRQPKYLHALAGGGRSLLQETYDRLTPLAAADRFLVVTGQAQAEAVHEQLPDLGPDQIVGEPFGRESCAAIGLAAAIIERQEAGAVMCSFAADHLITERKRFIETVRLAIAGAESGHLMTVGMAPTRVETGYGYVQCGAKTDLPGVRSVLRFQEKPSYATAAEYVNSGDYLWNASVFVWRTDAFLAALAQYSPEIHAGLTTIADSWRSPNRQEVLERVWPALPRVAIEYAVMEPAAADGKVATVPGDFGWHDIGDFNVLGQILAAGEPNVLITAAPADGDTEAPPPWLDQDSKDVVVIPRDRRLIATIGLRDIVIVDTPDVLLVCARDRAQDVKAMTELVRRNGLTDLL